MDIERATVREKVLFLIEKEDSSEEDKEDLLKFLSVPSTKVIHDLLNERILRVINADSEI